MVESRTVRVKYGNDHKPRYKDIVIPTETEIVRIVTELHDRKKHAWIDVLGWDVVYVRVADLESPSEAFPYFAFCTLGFASTIWQIEFRWREESDEPVKYEIHGTIVDSATENKLKGSATAKELTSADEITEPVLIEGAVRHIMVNAYERNAKARRRCIEHWGVDCAVCGFNFGDRYGGIGSGFIHVHHLRDLATIGREYEVDPVGDLRPVCPNCHAMLHTTLPAMSIEDLRKHLRDG